jgi:uncharacterized tellurite resistance protein B-like protein
MVLMFDQLLRRLRSPAPMPAPEASLAMAALLVRLARTDGSYDVQEVASIDRALVETFGLSPAAAGTLRLQAEALEAESPDTVRFTRSLKDAVPHDHRIGLVEAMWRVVLSDGTRDKDEESMMRLVSNLLGISDVDSALARQRVGTR